MSNEYVMLVEERILAEVVERNAFFSIVKYTSGGINFEVLVSNEEFDDYEGSGNDDTED